MWIDTSYWKWIWTHRALKVVYMDYYGWWRYSRPSNHMDNSLDCPQKFLLRVVAHPTSVNPIFPNLSFFLAFPNLGTRFLLRVVVCNIPDFWKVQKSQKFETFWIHVMQANKNPLKLKQHCSITYNSNVSGNKNPMITLKAISRIKVSS